jgi:hypothetical protein
MGKRSERSGTEQLLASPIRMRGRNAYFEYAQLIVLLSRARSYSRSIAFNEMKIIENFIYFRSH